jgi:hypothetical protein
MIAKSEWFVRRKYGGWGLFPKTWQGVLYSLVIVAISMGLIYLPVEFALKIAIIAVWAVLLLIDMGGAMINIKDEREKIHEAIAERNVLWAVVAIAAIGIAFQVASSTIKNDFSNVDWFLVAALGAAIIVKAISNIWLDRKN